MRSWGVWQYFPSHAWEVITPKPNEQLDFDRAWDLINALSEFADEDEILAPQPTRSPK